MKKFNSYLVVTSITILKNKLTLSAKSKFIYIYIVFRAPKLKKECKVY